MKKLIILLLLLAIIGLLIEFRMENRPAVQTHDDSVRALLEGDSAILNHSRIPNPNDTLQDPY